MYLIWYPIIFISKPTWSSKDVRWGVCDLCRKGTLGHEQLLICWTVHLDDTVTKTSLGDHTDNVCVCDPVMGQTAQGLAWWARTSPGNLGWIKYKKVNKLITLSTTPHHIL